MFDVKFDNIISAHVDEYIENSSSVTLSGIIMRIRLFEELFDCLQDSENFHKYELGPLSYAKLLPDLF